MVLWAWDADPGFGEAAGEQWFALLPQKWNPSRVQLYGYSPRACSTHGARDVPMSAVARRGATHAAE
tara:strand:+ start:149 stop:349 length:201 start_codon:yes stop_codon:yes gene_type:complete